MKYIFIINICIVAILLSFNISFADDVAPPSNPNSAKGCAICHFRWIDTFYIEGKGSALVDYTAEKVAATPEMCMSCHDGSVADSRAKMRFGFSHKVDVKPPADMKIPEIFPLGDGGKITCATCHTAHGVPSDKSSEGSIFLRTSNKNSRMCKMCHIGQEATEQEASKGKTIDPKILKKINEREHAPLTSKEKKKPYCESCHAAHGAEYDQIVIYRAQNSALCIECHVEANPLSPDVKGRKGHPVGVVPKGLKIPEELIKKGARLGVNNSINCLTCHKAHDNDIKHRLLEKNDINSSFCTECHTDKKYIIDTKHNLLNSFPEEKNAQGNTVKEAGVCSACHLPHKVARKVPAGKDIIAGTCLSCHSAGNIAKESQLKGVQHPLKDFSSKLIDEEKLRLPLFDKFGNPAKKGVMTCMTCHDPHRWSAYSTMGEIRKEVKGDRTTSFLRKKSPDICKECHADKFNIVNSKHDMIKTDPDGKNIFNETPSESGLCGSCHSVHKGLNPYLWARKISPTDDYVLNDLCLNCHSKDGSAKKKTVDKNSHPLNIDPEKSGITTTLPLFDVNGKTVPKGAIGCVTCHDPHRWDPVNVLNGPHYDTEGSSENSFLRLENSPAPKLCGNCHKDEAQIQNTDHDMNVSSVHIKNIKGQTPIESGTCGVCHLAHNSENKLRLWALDLGNGNSVMEKMCNSCHSKGKLDNIKVPAIASHPEDAIIVDVGKSTKDKPGYFPLFDEKTGELKSSGKISCPSCHNAHQWSNDFFKSEKRANEEGDATNSFLRNRAKDLPCKKCHGKEGLFRYLYFHTPEKRKNINP